MRVKAIMMPFSKLACISVENTVEEAMKIIDEQGLLSLPVVDGQQFVGVLSKQFLFDGIFPGTIQGPEKNLHSEK